MKECDNSKQSVPKRRHIKFRRLGVTQEKNKRVNLKHKNLNTSRN